MDVTYNKPATDIDSYKEHEKRWHDKQWEIKKLSTPAIKSLISDLVSVDDAVDFYSLCVSSQDQLVSLALEAYDYDIEIISSADSNIHLSKILHYVSDPYSDERAFLNKMKEAAREIFSSAFDNLISEERADREFESLEDAGKRPFMCSDNGEIIYP